MKLGGGMRGVSELFSVMEVARAFGRRPAEVLAWPRPERRAASWYLLLRDHYRTESMGRNK